jgi:hypothetical protein
MREIRMSGLTRGRGFPPYSTGLKKSPELPINIPMEINQAANMNIPCPSGSSCTDPLQEAVRVKMLKKSMDVEQDMMGRLLQSMGVAMDVGQHIDTVA